MTDLLDRVAQRIDPGAFDAAANCNSFGMAVRQTMARAKARKILDDMHEAKSPSAPVRPADAMLDKARR